MRSFGDYFLYAIECLLAHPGIWMPQANEYLIESKTERGGQLTRIFRLKCSLEGLLVRQCNGWWVLAQP